MPRKLYVTPTLIPLYVDEDDVLTTSGGGGMEEFKPSNPGEWDDVG